MEEAIWSISIPSRPDDKFTKILHKLDRRKLYKINQAPIFLQAALATEMMKDPQSGLKEKQYPTILKEDFPSRISPSLVFRKSNEINLVLSALKFKKALPNPYQCR